MNTSHLHKYQIEMLLIIYHLHQPYIGSYTKKQPKISIENLKRKGKFKILAEKIGKFNDKGELLKKGLKKYTKGKN